MRKSGPFVLQKITDQYPQYSRWLADKICNIEELPDFSDDKSIFVMSDYGGEHPHAVFNTYSFLISSLDRMSRFKHEMHVLRERHGLNAPFKKFAYKDLAYGPMGRSLEEFLHISDQHVHGVLVTVSVETSVPSLFGPEKSATQRGLVDLLSANDLGEWGSGEAEKLLRICHPVAMFLALLTHTGQKFLWMSDRDTITDDGSKRTFENSQQVFLHALRMYTDNEYEIYGFAKPFEKEPFTSDLLSLADFAAGAVQDVLQHLKAENVKDHAGKRQIIKWLGTASTSLQKVNILFQMDAGKLVCANVFLKAK
jgi:hypothetical protein